MKKLIYAFLFLCSVSAFAESSAYYCRDKSKLKTYFQYYDGDVANGYPIEVEIIGNVFGSAEFVIGVRCDNNQNRFLKRSNEWVTLFKLRVDKIYEPYKYDFKGKEPETIIIGYNTKNETFLRKTHEKENWMFGPKYSIDHSPELAKVNRKEKESKK